MLGETLTPPVLSADSFSLEISRGKFLCSTMETPCICPKIFPSRFSSLPPFPSRVRGSMRLIWQQKTLNANQPWHLFCMLLKRHWLQFRGVSSEKVPCQIVLKTCPFHLLSGYCTQMNRGFLSLETLWSRKCRNSTGGTNKLRALGCPRQAGSRTSVSSWGTSRSIFTWEPKFCTGSPVYGATENCWMWERKSGRKNLHIPGHREETFLSQFLFEFASSCKVLPVSKGTPF